MQNNLFLRRLIIVNDRNEYAYDECFHRGVNIIRGQNSSGKSTILRFIFFVLGGTYQDFVPEALRCQFVLAEIETNGQLLTLKRYLEKTDDGTRCKKEIPMYIYFGSIDNYKADQRPKNDKWRKYPYKVSTETHSFSNILFKYMGFPEFKADSNITMHQILRLIYLDQESPLSSLFFFDQWDKELTRETVARLLMGLYNSQLGQAKHDKEQVEKDIETVTKNKKVAAELLEDPDKMSVDYLKQYIRTLEEQVAHITDHVMELRNSVSDATSINVELGALNSKQRFEYQRVQADIAVCRKEYGQLENKVLQLKAEIDDSVYFIAALKKKKEALEHSVETRNFFDTLKLELCPVCHNELQKVEPGHCPVCNSPLDGSNDRTHATRIQLELDFQIRESESLLKESQAEYDDLKEKLRTKKRKLTAAQKQFDNAVRNVRSSREEEIDRYLQDKGYKEAEANQYRMLLEFAEKYDRYCHELAALKLRNEQLELFIKASESRIEIEQQAIDNAISANGVYMLNNDQARQSEFMQASDFKVNYKQNVAYISNQRIKLSASSAFYLKMAARFALFFASLQIDGMLYPRLLFSDNMEDKGMEPDRAENFQRLVVKRLQELSNQENYQLIFATSMIAPELDTPEYTIGDFYTQENKSLKNV